MGEREENNTPIGHVVAGCCKVGSGGTHWPVEHLDWMGVVVARAFELSS